MAVRICTFGVPKFRLHDLEINEQWLAVDKLTDKQRASLLAHAGRYVQVHRDDAPALERIGLVFESEPELDNRGEATGAQRRTGRVLEKKSNPKNDAPKGDAPKGAKKE